MSFSQEGNDASLSTSTIPPISASALEGWKTATTQIETLINPKTLMATFWRKQTRPDGRLLTQTRPTSIQTDIFVSSNNSNHNNNNIAGSALVRLGGTHVLAAVSLLIGQCTSTKTSTTSTSSNSSSSTGDHAGAATVARGGDIVVLVSTPDASSGGGGDNNNRDAQAESYLCQSFLQRILHETMDLEQLLIDTTNNTSTTSHRKASTSRTGSARPNILLAFRLQVTVRVLANNGNMVDAALLASVAALQQSHLPTNLEFDDFGKVVAWNFGNDDSSSPQCRSLQMPLLPVPLSMGTINIKQQNHDNDDKNSTTANTARWIVDPTRAEQDVLQNALTVVVNAREPHQVLAVEFSSSTAESSGISTTDLGVAVHMATARAKEVQSLFLKI